MSAYLYTVRTRRIPIVIQREDRLEFAVASPLTFFASRPELTDGLRDSSQMHMLRGRLRKLWADRPLPSYVIEGQEKPGAALVAWDSPHTSRCGDLAGGAWWDTNALHIIGRLTEKGPRGWRVTLTDLPCHRDEIAQLRRQLSRADDNGRRELFDRVWEIQREANAYEAERIAAAGVAI